MKRLSFLLVFALLVFSCGKDEEPDDNNNMNGTMTVVKDGVSHTIDATNNTLVIALDNGREGRRLDVRCNVDGGTLIVTVSNWDFQNPPADGILTKSYKTNEEDPWSNPSCLDENGFSYCDGGLGTFTIGLTEIYSSEGFNIEEEGIINITANDPAAKTVSGNFEMKMEKFNADGSNEIIDFSGTFADLEYRIQ